MTDFIKHNLERVFNIEKLMTVFYLEFSKDFFYEGESHDFWELVYIDKGEMICTAENKQFILKGGEVIFHKPNEFHNLTSNNIIAPNVSIVTFECKNKNMKFFEEKILKLNSDEKKILSQIIEEGLSAFKLANIKPPITGMTKIIDSPFGSQQMTKILLEQFLITLYRRDKFFTKQQRSILFLNYEDYPDNIKEIIKFLQDNKYSSLNIKTIAKTFNFSESKLKKTFSEYVKSGVIDYFIKIKITEAKRLIREEQLNFTQIAEKLCYSSVYYFSKQFKYITGMTPTQYLNSIKD